MKEFSLRSITRSWATNGSRKTIWNEGLEILDHGFITKMIEAPLYKLNKYTKRVD